jgi:hypothetical protein
LVRRPGWEYAEHFAALILELAKQAQFWREAGRGLCFGGGFSLGSGPFREQSAFDFGEKADIVRRFEAFPGDFGERSHDVKTLFANHFRLRCC